MVGSNQEEKAKKKEMDEKEEEEKSGSPKFWTPEGEPFNPFI